MKERRVIKTQAPHNAASIEARVAEADLTAEWALRQALVKIERRSSAKQVFFSWPNLHEVCLRLAAYATNLYPSNGMTFLEATLMRAFDDYDSACIEQSAIEKAPMYGFLNALISNQAPSLLDYQPRAESAGIRVKWQPMSEPLSDWLRRYKIKQIRFELTSASQKAKEGAGQLLAEAILSHRERHELAEWKGKP